MDVDTQFDFVSTEGAFGEHVASWHIERIVPKLQQIARYTAERNITTILPTDAHVPHDPEFADDIPEHCVIGSVGQRRIPETDIEPTITIENRAGAFDGHLPPTDRLVVKVNKQHFAVGTNPNFAALVEALGPCHVFATGVATQGCVAASIGSLIELGVPVTVVVDAVGPDIYEDAGRAAIEQLEALGVLTVTTDQLCEGALERHITPV
jgi:nicotinamidase-related amidase